MSSMSNPVRIRSLLPAGLPRPRLTIVPKVAARAPRVPFVILVVLVLGGGLIGLLLLNTSLQRGAYEITDLRGRSAALAAQEQSLRMAVSDLRQPHRVARAALALGMVRSDNPAFLDLATGVVTGSAVPADKTDTPRIGLRPGLASSQRAEKAMPLPAGSAAGEATGFVHVPKVRSSTPDRDTAVSSTAHQAGQDTNNSSNIR
jgi:hypothetical protein